MPQQLRATPLQDVVGKGDTLMGAVVPAEVSFQLLLLQGKDGTVPTASASWEGASSKLALLQNRHRPRTLLQSQQFAVLGYCLLFLVP